MVSVAFAGFVAAPLRTIVMPQAAGVAPRIAAAPAIAAALPSKAAGETLDYSLNLDGWLAEVDDAIVGVTITVEVGQAVTADPNDLGVVWLTLLQGRPVFTLSGGRPSITYTTIVQVETAVGRVGRFAPTLTIADWDVASPPLPPLPAPPNALAVSATELLTTDSGSPLLLA